MMQRVRQPFNVNAPAQWAALAALDDAEHVRRSLAVNRQGHRLSAKRIHQARIGVRAEPCANFILVRVGKGQEVFKQLLSQGVIVRPMAGYQFPEHVRVTVGTMDENREIYRRAGKVIKTF